MQMDTMGWPVPAHRLGFLGVFVGLEVLFVGLLTGLGLFDGMDLLYNWFSRACNGSLREFTGFFRGLQAF